MPLTTLDSNTALLVVDLQKGLIASPFAHAFGQVLDRSRALADAFRAKELPVVLINVAGRAPGRTEQAARHSGSFAADFTEFLPELAQRPSDIVITKHTWGAFAGTILEHQLKALGVTQTVICGVATGTGVESTARQAYELGFNVTLALDAMTDTRPQAHDYSIGQVFPRLGETGTTEEIIDLLNGVHSS